MKYKGCIFLISARKNILHECLINIDRNYNNQFNYPILIFYHGTKYDDVSFRKTIENYFGHDDDFKLKIEVGRIEFILSTNRFNLLNKTLDYELENIDNLEINHTENIL